MLCAVKEGQLTCRRETGESERIDLSDGVAYVADNRVTLLLKSLRGKEEEE